MSTMEFGLWLGLWIYLTSGLQFDVRHVFSRRHRIVRNCSDCNASSGDIWLRSAMSEVRGGDALSKDLLSPNCHRIRLQKQGVSTFLNVHDTISHLCELQRFSPALHPLFSEIMMRNESQFGGCWIRELQPQWWQQLQEQPTVHGSRTSRTTGSELRMAVVSL